MKVIGLRIEKYIGQEVSARNGDFEYNDAEFEKHVICCIDKVSNGVTEITTMFEIELSREESVCGSGWTTAFYGNMEINQVKKFNGFTHLPIKPLTIPQFDASFDRICDDIENNVFYYSYDGDDPYYPCGGYYVNMELFINTLRAKSLRPTYVFTGESGIGKSFLASKFDDIVVCETDGFDILPEIIIADVIVLGNKHGYTINDISSRIRDTELVVCSFVSFK